VSLAAYTRRVVFLKCELGNAMPHVIIRYRLPDDQADFTAAMQGRNAKTVIGTVDQYCRHILKHCEKSEETRAHLELIRDMLRESPGLLDD